MRYILYAILLATAVPLYAQEIRLDSLWIKMGGYPTMAFSPDSKTLLLGQADGIVNIVNVQSGIPADSIILPKNGYADFGFSPDGKYLIVSERKKITFYSALTWDSVGVSPAILSTGYISFSNDNKYVAVADRASISIINLIENTVVAEINRPQYFKDSQNENSPYFNGKVYFSEDGTRLYGKNANDFGFWDLTKKDTPFSRSFTIGNRAVIGFTPDRKYMIQQSNYIWDLNTKSQIQIQGLAKNSYDINGNSAAITSDSKYVFCTDNVLSIVINIPEKKIAANPNRYAINQIVSPNNDYYAFSRDGAVRIYRMSLNSTLIADNADRPSVNVRPLPSSSTINIVVVTENPIEKCTIRIGSVTGEIMNNFYSGNLDIGEHQFYLDSKEFASGEYFVIISHAGKNYSYPFIISK